MVGSALSQAETSLTCLLEDLRKEVDALREDRRRLIGEVADREDTIRRQRRELAAVAAVRDQHMRESAERLTVIHRLEVLSEQLRVDGDARLAVIQRLEAQLASERALSEHLRVDGDARLAVIQRLEARIAGKATGR